MTRGCTSEENSTGTRKGVEYEATAKPMRERFQPKQNKARVRPIRHEKEDDGINEQTARYNMSPDQSGVQNDVEWTLGGGCEVERSKITKDGNLRLLQTLC